MIDYKVVLLKLNENLNILREREAKYAGNAPAELINQINDHQKAIALTKQVIAGEISKTDWRKGLRLLMASLGELARMIFNQSYQQVDSPANIAVNVPPPAKSRESGGQKHIFHLPGNLTDLDLPLPMADLVSELDMKELEKLIEEQIRLDVASPETVEVNRTFEIAVRISQPGSPPLNEADLTKVTSKPGKVYRTDDQEVVRYRVKVSAPDCEVPSGEQEFLLRRGEDSEVIFFQLTARRDGAISIIVTAYQDNDLLAATTRLRLVATLTAQSGSTWNTASMRDLLTTAFDDESLTTLCYDHFRAVYEEFGTGMSKGQKIQRLLEYCDRHQQVTNLLVLVKEQNPAQYARFTPGLHP